MRIPLLWRYLLRNYFQVFTLCVSGFIAILLVTRFRDIASFATTGAGWSTVGLFTLYQIPYILPLAIPVSALIAAILLFQSLSHTHEMTALRACGLKLKTITFPLLIAGIFLTLVNFTIVSELGPICKSRAKHLAYEMAMLNPLSLFQKDAPLKIKDIYVDIHKFESGKHAEDVVLVLKNLSNERLGIMTAKELWIDGESLLGKEVTLISSLDPKKENSFDHLIIENQAIMSTRAASLSELIQSADLELHYDYLPMRLILAKRMLHKSNAPYNFGKGELEIVRRLSLSLAAFSFTVIGLSFGLEISRNRSKNGIIWAISLAALFMICFVGAKSFHHAHITAALLFLLPHPLIFLLSLRAFKRVIKGVE
ncbi:MAG: LptF/LptG family permease [Chlamydiota bacterium]